MKLVLKRELFQHFWKKPIEKVRDSARKKKITEFCQQQLRDNNITLTRDIKQKLGGEIKNFLRNFKEKEIEFIEEGKFYFEVTLQAVIKLGAIKRG